MEIKTQLISKSAKGRRPQIPMQAEWITIHSTANPRSTAQNEADNVRNNNPDAKISFHWVVDDKEAINVIPENEIAWHAGDGNGAGNMSSIGVEICESGDRIQVLLNTIRLVIDIQNRHNIPINKVVQHNYWNGKDCPRILRNSAYIKNDMNWGWFIVSLEQQNINTAQNIKDTKVTIGNSVINARLIDGVTYVPIREFVDTLKSELEVTWDKIKGAEIKL